MQTGKILGATLLVSCTTIGGGVLALPTNTIAGGFFPSVFAFILCWFFLSIGAFLLLEVSLWSKTETNLISMADSTIGSWGKILAWINYILLLYALISTYLTASTAWFQTLIQQNFSINLSKFIAAPIIAIITGLFIFLGTAAADKLNRLLSLGLIIAYIILATTCIHKVDTSYLDYANFANVPKSISLIVTTFGFAIVVPVLAHYLNRNTKDLLIAITIGSLIPLVFYLIWEYITLGTLSIKGPFGLSALAAKQANSTEVALALEHVIGNPLITTSAKFFSIFAILTSLIGVALSLFHFLADGLKVPQQGMPGIQLFLLTFIPPLLIVLFFPAGFDKILSFGGIFVAFLLGLLPVLMAYYGRYKRNKSGSFKVFGGKPLLIVTGLFFIYVIAQETINVSATLF